MEFWGICPPNVKKFFQGCFSLDLKILGFFRFCQNWFERGRITVSEQNISKNIFCNGSFKYLSTLRNKNIFKYNSEVFLSLVLKIQSLVFASMKVLGELRVTVWERNFFYRIVCIESIKYVSTLCKRFCQLYQWRFSLLRPESTQFF